MYKNLSAIGLGISGRQSELIELALTYGFEGLDVDMAQFAKQVETRGLERARQFLDSAQIAIGCFDLPVRWQEDDKTYQQDLVKLEGIASLAASVNATRCRTVVMPACDVRPYHENFEFHRHRFTQIGEVLAKHGISLGLDFLPPFSYRDGRLYQFIFQAEPLVLLAKTVGLPNVGVIVDLWNWHVGAGSIEMFEQLEPNQVIEVRASDVPAAANLQVIGEDQRLLPSAGGSVDIQAVLAALHKLGYEGPITPWADSSSLVGLKRDETVSKASKLLDGEWNGKPYVAPVVIEAETSDADADNDATTETNTEETQPVEA